MAVVLDTTFLVDVIRGDAAAVSLMEELETSGEALLIPTVVVYELWEGIERSRAPIRELEIVEEALRGNSILDLRMDHAERAGRISGNLIRRGARIGDADVLIGSMALVEDAALVTRNARDFERVPDLRVRTY